ncbi:ribonuclease H-like domain-containing protein [Tanacetum coccineum]|uniref:Ribonuclease H-like domain-containing protein n=1 Tax=Tanacetum coccineum TaxID=301880 RepID=A0ABQ5D0G3_9ASTR
MTSSLIPDITVHFPSPLTEENDTRAIHKHDLKDKGVIEVMLKAHDRNMSYLTDLEEMMTDMFPLRGNHEELELLNKYRAVRKIETLIEAARIMLADSKLPTTFWAEAVNTACYVQNRVKLRMRQYPGKDYILYHYGLLNLLFSTSSRSSPDAGSKPSSDGEKKVDGDPRKEDERDDQEKDDNINSTNNVNTASDRNNTNNVNAVSSNVNAADIEVNAVGAKISIELPDDPNMPDLEEIAYSDDDEDVGAEVDINNISIIYAVSLFNYKIHKDHPVEQNIGDLKSYKHHKQEGKDKELFALAIYQMVTAISTKWVYMNKKDERCIVIKNKARIEAIRLFLAYASFKDFMVYQMDVKSAFLYGKNKESMIGSFMYLTSSRPVIIFQLCACAKIPVNPKDSPFDLVAYTDSDYAGAILDRKSTTGGCQFLRCRLISWQCKKQTVVVNSTTEAEYVAAVPSALDSKINFLLRNGIGVNDGDSRLMLLGINLLLLGKVNAARHKLTTAVESKEYYKPDGWKRRLSSLVNCEEEISTGRCKRCLNVQPNATIFQELTRTGVTPLFPTMVVQAQEEMGEGSAMPTDPHHTPIITQPSSSQPQRKQKSRRPKRKDTEIPQSSVPSDHTNVADKAINEEPSMQLNELMDFYTKLQQIVLYLENTKTAQA